MTYEARATAGQDRRKWTVAGVVTGATGALAVAAVLTWGVMVGGPDAPGGQAHRVAVPVTVTSTATETSTATATATRTRAVESTATVTRTEVTAPVKATGKATGKAAPAAPTGGVPGGYAEDSLPAYLQEWLDSHPGADLVGPDTANVWVAGEPGATGDCYAVVADTTRVACEGGYQGES